VVAKSVANQAAPSASAASESEACSVWR